MSNSKNFPFEKARRIKKTEVESARKAIEKKSGQKRKVRKGRPPKVGSDKYVPIAIRLHPEVLKWAKREAKKRGVGYQTIINEILLKEAA